MFSSPTKTAWWLATFFSVFVTGEMPIQGEIEPEFLQALENHTVTQGRDVHFTCVVNHLSNYRVAWIKSDSKAILAIHTNMVALNPRLSVTYNNHNTWKLHVSNVQANDSGTYMCQVNTDPMKSQMGYLSVVIPPDIVDSVAEGSTAQEGGSVRLTCTATGEPPPTVQWRREHNKPIVFRHEGGRERKVVDIHRGETLELQHVQRTDMGVYFCIASNGIPPTISRRYHVEVHFIPQVKVTNQLVGAPLGSNVELQCYIEASPKAMNSWYREDGKSLVSDKILENPKLRINEHIINDYSRWMNLTIKSLAQGDYGTYVCASVNALGKMEGQVSLHMVDIHRGETLELQHVQRTDMGVYFCIASNGIPPTISRRYHVEVHFIPQVKVTNQLVGAPLGSNVELQCYIEASPKAMNSWYREDGKSLVSDKILENPKLRINEHIINDYSRWMNLTIKSLAQGDYGTYVCASVNALGKMEGQVSLHRLELSMNGFGAEEPMVSGAAWQRARSLPSARARPAASHAHQYSLTDQLPPQLYALLLTAVRYLNTF